MALALPTPCEHAASCRAVHAGLGLHPPAACRHAAKPKLFVSVEHSAQCMDSCPHSALFQLPASAACVNCAGGFSGNSFAYFLLSFLIVAGGIVVYTASGDVYSTSSTGSRSSDAGEAAAGVRKAGAGSSRHEYVALGPSEEGEGTCAAAGHAAEAGLLAPGSLDGEERGRGQQHHMPQPRAGSPFVQGPVEGGLRSRSSEEGAQESGSGGAPSLPPVRVQGQAGAEVLHFGIESPSASWGRVCHGRSGSP